MFYTSVNKAITIEFAWAQSFISLFIYFVYLLQLKFIYNSVGNGILKRKVCHLIGPHTHVSKKLLGHNCGITFIGRILLLDFI